MSDAQMHLGFPPRGLCEIEDVMCLFRRHGVTVVYSKEMAPKQDNDKNQIYLGDSLNEVSNIFPIEIDERGISSSRTKPGSKFGMPITQARFNFCWMDRAGSLFPAPEAKIIYYFQFPEIRLSGFLSGCNNASDALRRRFQTRFGKRMFLLGVTPEGVVVGMVLTEVEDPVVKEWPEFPSLPASPVLKVINLDGTISISNRGALLNELRTIFDMGWVKGQKLKKGESGSKPFKGTQGGGYTLEALLGIHTNANQAPDKYGYEVKSKSKSNRVSLMTPTADRGFEGNRDNTFREFMGRYGWPCKNNPAQICFNGTHYNQIECKSSGMTLNIDGYNPENSEYTLDAKDVQVALTKSGEKSPAAAWSLYQMIKAWSKKHAAAVYVSTEKNPALNQYRYGRRVWIAEGTKVEKLLDAIYGGHVVYDPGHKIREDGTPKVRPQWRLIWNRNMKGFKSLYDKAEMIEI